MISSLTIKDNTFIYIEQIDLFLQDMFISMRKIFNTIFDIATGFRVNRELKKVLEMDTWEREFIDRYQYEKFENLRKYAVRSEIYKVYINTDFARFPKFSKEFFQQHIRQFRIPSRKPYRLIYTSGSTGNPKKIFVSKEMLLAKLTSNLKMLSWYNLKREYKELHIGGLTQSFSTRIYYYLKNKVFLPSNNLTRQRAREYIKIINKHKPKILFSYPYALDIILCFAEQLKEKLHQPVIVYTGGENLLPHIKNHIRQHFPESNIVNEYWATEANIGVSCPEGHLHVDEDTIMIETDNLDENGFGDLLITNFYSFDLPLIRYDLGDRVKLSDIVCPCGRKSRIIEEIKGRTVDYYYLKDGRRIAYMDMRISKFVDNVMLYQVIHHKKDDTFLFKYVLRDNTRPLDTTSLYNFFRKNLGVTLNFKKVDHILSEPSGKYCVYKTV